MIGHLDCFSGVSGDKCLGALVGAGVPIDDLTSMLVGLPLDGWSLRAEEVKRAGFAGTQVSVDAPAEQPHRTWDDIRGLVSEADLPESVREKALAVFEKLADAEARAHGMDSADVHFHEVGAVDSIIDIVGTVAGLHLLGIDRLTASPVTVGSGTVECQHGTLPVPAPATALLLEGIPLIGGHGLGEATTPTGAALIATLVDGFGPIPAMVPISVGLGAGSRDGDVPNLLRLIVGQPAQSGGSEETIVALRSVIDHRTPEDLADALDRIREDGALDAWQSPVVMKKGRAGFEVTVLAHPIDSSRLTDALMTLTGTLGVRREFVSRTVAERAIVSLSTSDGEVRFKVAKIAGRRILRPEQDDVAEVARRTGEPTHEVSSRLVAQAEEMLGEAE